MARKKLKMRYVYDPRSCARLAIHGPKPYGYIEAKSKAECERIVRAHGGGFSGLGFTPAEHRSRAGNYVKTYRFDVARLRRAIRSGDCGEAVHDLTVAALSYGNLWAHKLGATYGRHKVSRGSTGMIHRLASNVVKVCKVKGRR